MQSSDTMRTMNRGKLVACCVGWLSIGAICIACFDTVAFGQRPSRLPTAAAQPATQNTVTQQDFDTLAAQASAARDADKIDEAITLYRRALAAKPDWAEGWWFLGTLYYDQNKFGEAAPAFRQAAQIQSKAGAPWVMLGLCEFQL